VLANTAKTKVHYLSKVLVQYFLFLYKYLNSAWKYRFEQKWH